MSERVAHAQDELAEAVDMAGKRQEIAFDCAYRQIACGLTQGLKELAAGIDREYRETRRASGIACMPKPAPRSTAWPVRRGASPSASISWAPRVIAASTPPAIQAYTGPRCAA